MSALSYKEITKFAQQRKSKKKKVKTEAHVDRFYTLIMTIIEISTTEQRQAVEAVSIDSIKLSSRVM